MKIMFFFRDLMNGGVQRNLLRFSKILIEQKHEVHFAITASSQEEFPPPTGLAVHRLETRSPALMAWRLARLYDQIEPDVVFAAMPNYNTIAVISKYLSRRKPYVIVSERSHTLVELRNSKLSIYKLSILLSPVVYRFADAITAVSEETAGSLAKYGRFPIEAIQVIHNPVVSESLKELAREPVQHEWLDKDYKTILAVGRLVAQKDYQTLLEAFAILNKLRDDARLIIIGEGELYVILSELATKLGIQEFIEFRGFDPNPYKWMAHCDVFVLSSLWEGLPTVIIEAMACGSTIVATDSPSGPRQILGNEAFGYLAPLRDPEALARKLNWALDHQMERVRLMASAERYSEDAAIRAFLTVAARAQGYVP